MHYHNKSQIKKRKKLIRKLVYYYCNVFQLKSKVCVSFNQEENCRANHLGNYKHRININFAELNKVFRDGVGGYYFNRDKKMRLVKYSKKIGLRIVLLHELHHCIFKDKLSGPLRLSDRFENMDYEQQADNFSLAYCMV